MEDRWPWMDWHPETPPERAELELEEECLTCGRLVSGVGRLTCPACGEEDP